MIKNLRPSFIVYLPRMLFVRVQFSNVVKLANLQTFIIYSATEAAKEANVFKFHQGDDKLLSGPHESIEEFETRV